MSKIRHATFNEFRKIVESLEQELTGSLPYCESGTQPDFSPELVSFELGRALGRLEGYSDYYYGVSGCQSPTAFPISKGASVRQNNRGGVCESTWKG